MMMPGRWRRHRPHRHAAEPREELCRFIRSPRRRVPECSGKDTVYGRKIVVDLPDNKGRTTGVFYFTKGKLIVLEATVLSAHGNSASPEPGRFVDSIAFTLSPAQSDVVELGTPQFE
jgi:hypothetical protein